LRLRNRICDALGFRRTYVQGVFSDSDRTSMQAMLTRVTEPVAYQAFQHFVTHAPWDADRIWRRLVEILPERRGVLILDGTSFPRQGLHSVGVARQYRGALGKIANCQVAVTAALWTETRAFAYKCLLSASGSVPSCPYVSHAEPNSYKSDVSTTLRCTTLAFAT
jgi:SRSO17 transposase